MDVVARELTSNAAKPDPEGLPVVLIICLSIRHGGVDVRIVQTARELDSRGADYRVVVIAGTRLHQTLEQAGLKVVALTRRRSDPRIVGDLVQLIRDSGAQVIDAHNTQSQYWAALAALRTGIPGRVATVHSVYREDHKGRLRQRAHEGAIRLCHRAGFRFIAVSSNVERYLIDVMSISRPLVLLSRNGMEDLAEVPVPFDLRAETGWPPDTMLLAIIGRLDPRKGHRFVLEAIRDLVAEGERRVRLLIVGTGREEPHLRALVAELGLEAQVHFTGFRDDVGSILTRTDLLCLPSTSEGLPYSVLEAARQSVPVLASKLEGTDDVFSDGETIFFTAPGDVASITSRLKDLLAAPDHRRAVGDAARQLFLEALQAHRMVGETLGVYRAAARARQR